MPRLSSTKQRTTQRMTPLGQQFIYSEPEPFTQSHHYPESHCQTKQNREKHNTEALPNKCNSASNSHSRQQQELPRRSDKDKHVVDVMKCIVIHLIAPCIRKCKYASSTRIMQVTGCFIRRQQFGKYKIISEGDTSWRDTFFYVPPAHVRYSIPPQKIRLRVQCANRSVSQ